VDTDTAIVTELNGLRRRVPDVTGSVLTGVDGLLITHDLASAEAESIAALAAASVGLGRRFAMTAGHGDLRETVIHGSRGQVALYPVGDRALLAVLAGPGTDPGLLHAHGRRAARSIGELLRSRPAGNVAAPVPGLLDNHAPLAVRTPMATLPYNPALPRRRF